MTVRRRPSFIITARNEPPALLERTLDELIETTSGWREIIVIDDGSTVPVSCDRAGVAVFRSQQPLGVSPCRRIGAGIATGDVLVWLDAHMRFAPDWLDPMLTSAESGALLCAAFWDYELATCLCWGADFTWCSERDYWSQKFPGFGVRHRVAPPSAPLVDIPMILGACYMIERRSYQAIGGFSPLLRVWGNDEQDMSARAWIAGVGVKCVTGSRVGHFSRSSFPYPVQFEHLEFNQLVMIRSVFQPETVERLERYFDPIPPIVQEWLAAADITSWRQQAQAGRRWSDAEFLAWCGLSI